VLHIYIYIYIYIYDISTLRVKWKILVCGADDIVFILDLCLCLFVLLDLFISVSSLSEVAEGTTLFLARVQEAIELTILSVFPCLAGAGCVC